MKVIGHVLAIQHGKYLIKRQHMCQFNLTKGWQKSIIIIEQLQLCLQHALTFQDHRWVVNSFCQTTLWDLPYTDKATFTCWKIHDSSSVEVWIHLSFTSHLDLGWLVRQPLSHLPAASFLLLNGSIAKSIMPLPHWMAGSPESGSLQGLVSCYNKVNTLLTHFPSFK